MDTLESHKLDLSGQCLKKLLPQLNLDSHKITSLHLDNNELQKLESIDKFSSVVELSASHNQIVRMYPVSHLQHLVKLDLSYNTILTIEGLKCLVHLKYLNLSSNKIKTIERLQSNLLLEHLDLSENSITGISNISDLSKLKKLFLHKNMITQLRHAEVYLPKSLVSLTLAGNNISDLAEIGHLVDLPNLRELSIVSNPCVDMTGNSLGFDYRPFLINWCIELKVIDGFAVDDIERLKAEWLYSQGRGRKYKPSQHSELVKYLVETCPLNNQSLMCESERKLRLILSKAHHHQMQLKMAEQPASSDRTLPGELMTRSLDNSLLESCSPHPDYPSHKSVKQDISLTRSLCETPGFGGIISEENMLKSASSRSPLPAATKLVPVPESLVSPLVSNPPPMPLSSNGFTPDQVSAEKLQTIKHLAQKKREKKYDSNNRELAAMCIQKLWRGYRARHLHPVISSMQQHLQVRRTHQHIKKLSDDIEGIQKALDNEHKLQVLQMQATNALWKKVQELQNCMQEVLRCVSPSISSSISTQTDITAVHSPTQEPDKIPFSRPSSLLLNRGRVMDEYGENIIEEAILESVQVAHPAILEDQQKSVQTVVNPVKNDS